jgi:poly(A) polymerase
LADVPQSRLFDEMLKLLQTGHALASITQLQQRQLRGIYPLLDVTMDRAEVPLVQHALLDTDRRVAQGKPVAPSFLLACVLWSDVYDHWQQRRSKNQPAHQALQEAVDQVFESRIGDVSGRGKLGIDMREIWMMQPRFERRSGSAPFSLVGQPRFRAGFDFLRLRTLINEVPEELAHWWESFSLADDAHRRDMVEALRVEQQQQQRQKAQARRAKATPAAALPTTVDATPAMPDATLPTTPNLSDSDEIAPARRRRRRRKPKIGDAGPPSLEP